MRKAGRDHRSLSKPPPMVRPSVSARGAFQRQKSKSVPDLRNVVSRKDVMAVTMNMSGRTGLGLTPRFKIDMVKEYLNAGVPDVIVIQDAIDSSDMAGVLDAVGHGSYQWYFRPDLSSGTMNDHDDNDEDNQGHCLTGIAWNKEKYMGTPLQIDDQRLSEYSKWLKKHNIVIVKLDSCQRTNSGAEDVYPSFVAISWHGPDYEIALRQRNQICEEFFSFLSLLRKNNWFVPILIGGDFNIDLKSFNFDNHTDYLYVPYRPISGNLAKDLKNTFLFTVDSLQVTETSFKQFHPDIYPSPFISVRLRGRTKIKIWAVVRIQRCIRAYLRRAKEKRLGKKKLKDSKKRWKRKIEGDNYVSEPDSDDDELATKIKSLSRQQSSFGANEKNHQLPVPPTAPVVNDALFERKISGASFNEPLAVPVVNHRRKKYSDLKSIYEKQQEMRSNEVLMRSYTPQKKAEKFEF